MGYDQLMERLEDKLVYAARIERDVQSKVSGIRSSLKRIEQSSFTSEFKKKIKLKNLLSEVMHGKYKLNKRDFKKVKKTRTDIKMLSKEVLSGELETQLNSLSLTLDSYVEGVRKHSEFREEIFRKIYNK